jgi:ubiquinone/menaquinone biosynthesis C-methylase UbiE
MTDVFTLPDPEEVGGFYDENNHLIARFQGGNMHYGYWTGPDDDSDYEVAGARLTDVMIDKLGVEPGDEVLDVGCGPGKPAVQLARATGARVLGISISTEDVRLATARAEAEGVADQVRFRHADALSLPFPAESFDAVLALESIVHIQERARVLEQIARVLRPGGRVVLTDFVTLRPEGQESEVDRRALAHALAAWRAAPLVRAEDYPGFVDRAGLVLDEITDITERTKYTFAKTYEAIDEYVARGGRLSPDMKRIHAMGRGVDWAAVAEEEQTEGVVIVLAHRPG